jgi:PKHD-type hydroxylase
MIRNFVCYDRFLSEEECDLIVSDAKDIEVIDGKTGGHKSSDLNEHIRISKIKWINADNPDHWKKYQWLFEKMDKQTALVNSCYFDVDYRYNGCTAFQYTIYHGKEAREDEKGGFYDQHIDHMLPGAWADARKISFSIQLTDPSEYEGGLLSFRDTCGEQPPDFFMNKGSICYFPSNLHHGVSPVTTGKRESLVGWYRGPQWR